MDATAYFDTLQSWPAESFISPIARPSVSGSLVVCELCPDELVRRPLPAPDGGPRAIQPPVADRDLLRSQVTAGPLTPAARS